MTVYLILVLGDIISQVCKIYDAIGDLNGTGTQMLIAIIAARSMTNAWYYGVMYARSGLLSMRRPTSRNFEG